MDNFVEPLFYTQQHVLGGCQGVQLNYGKFSTKISLTPCEEGLN